MGRTSRPLADSETLRPADGVWHCLGKQVSRISIADELGPLNCTMQCTQACGRPREVRKMSLKNPKPKQTLQQ